MRYPVLSHIDSLCSLAYYIIKLLPLHSALLLFQAFFHTFLPVWLEDNFFQQVVPFFSSFNRLKPLSSHKFVLN